MFTVNVYSAAVISVVLPTYNEAENLSAMLAKIAQALALHPYEVIIVDDNSPDETWRVAEELRAQYSNLRIIRRMHERGLSSAAVAGFAAATGEVLCLMDSDGQHDPALLPGMLQAVENGAGIVVGSRYMPGGSVGEWIHDRRILSRIGTWLAQCVSRTDVTDPLSGLFMIKRELFVSIHTRLRPSGFKILLEILAYLPRSVQLREVPLIFQMRHAGVSKLSWRVQWEFVCQIVRLAFVR